MQFNSLRHTVNFGRLLAGYCSCSERGQRGWRIGKSTSCCDGIVLLSYSLPLYALRKNTRAKTQLSRES